MARIAILTDSSANLHPVSAGGQILHIIPLTIHWSAETLYDGVDITPAEFYARLVKDPAAPTTSQPSPSDFLKRFEELSQSCDGILVLLISSGISGSVNSAQIAAGGFNKVPVAVVDTHSTSAGLALVVQAALRAAEQGCTLQEVRQAAVEVIQRLHVFFMVDTLKYLHRGGRIGGAAHLFGSAFDIRPILCFDAEGKLDALERVRTRKKALARLGDLAEERLGGRPARLSVLHADDPAAAEALRGCLAERFHLLESSVYEISPVIGVHVGPGTIGVAFYPDGA